MGSSGVDIQLSPAAAAVFPYSVECKNHAKFAVYGMYAQCVANSSTRTPLLVIKQNHSDPLAVVSLKHFMELTQSARQAVVESPELPSSTNYERY